MEHSVKISIAFHETKQHIEHKKKRREKSPNSRNKRTKDSQVIQHKILSNYY